MSLKSKRPIPANINIGLNSPPNRLMLELLGSPRNTYDQECRPPTNRPFKDLVRHKDVGPFKVWGLGPALDSLTEVMADIREEQPDVYEVLGHMGMLCCRNIRGSKTSISNHSFGTAIDLTIDGILDDYGDGTVQLGLVKIYPIFNRHGWYWGAAFRKEDGMHFEVSREMMMRWNEEGLLGAPKPLSVAAMNLSRGARGVNVRALQEALIAHDLDLDPDGIYGAATEAAVLLFQQRHGLLADGIAGPQVFAKLKELEEAGASARTEPVPSPTVAAAATTPAAAATGPINPGGFKGEGRQIDVNDIIKAAAILDVEPEALWAVKVVESGQWGSFFKDGRPPILFERHIFFKKTGGRFAAKHPDLCNKVPGGYGKAGMAQYDRLERAMGLDRAAALESASFGAFQLMGMNWKDLKYDSVDDLVRRLLTVEGQLDGLIRFIRRNKIDDELRPPHNWAGFARVYNGPKFRDNDYDGKLKRAYDAARQNGMGGPSATASGRPTLKLGDDGTAVEELQQLLNERIMAGIAVDGDFGPATRDAVMDFQSRMGLDVDGKVGPQTWAALDEENGDIAAITAAHANGHIGSQPSA